MVEGAEPVVRNGNDLLWSGIAAIEIGTGTETEVGIVPAAEVVANRSILPPSGTAPPMAAAASTVESGPIRPGNRREAATVDLVGMVISSTAAEITMTIIVKHPVHLRQGNLLRRHLPAHTAAGIMIEEAVGDLVEDEAEADSTTGIIRLRHHPHHRKDVGVEAAIGTKRIGAVAKTLESPHQGEGSREKNAALKADDAVHISSIRIREDHHHGTGMTISEAETAICAIAFSEGKNSMIVVHGVAIPPR